MANDTEQNAWPDVEHSPVATDEFTGFANSPVDEDGKRVDPREVDAYVDETDEGKARQESQSTESSIVAFKTEGPATNGAPAAVVGKTEAYGSSDAEEAEPVDSDEVADSGVADGDTQTPRSDPDRPAEGEGANEDS